MPNLEPLVARFVDALLRAIRRATLDELCEALEEETPGAPRPRARAQAPAAAPHVDRPRPPRSRNAAARGIAPKPPPPSELPTIGEITEPEKLLAVVANHWPSPAGPDEIEEPQSEAAPASGERVVAGLPPRLRQGEAAVAVRGSTFVIRRAKRA